MKTINATAIPCPYCDANPGEWCHAAPAPGPHAALIHAQRARLTTAHNQIVRAFPDYETPPTLAPVTTMPELHATHRGHYFDPETLAHFGDTQHEIAAPGIMISRQPDEQHPHDPWKITAWYIHRGNPTPRNIGRAPSRSYARALAEALTETWPQ